MNRKLFIFALATLLCLSLTGVANATGIPQVADPKNYPVVWTEEVYSNSAAAVTSGYVVIWDFDSSTGDYADKCNWVKVSDAADSIWTAGVMITDSCPVNGICSIAIRGPVGVIKAQGSAVTQNTVVSTTATGGLVDETGGADKTILGIAIDSAGTTIGTFVDVFVNPTTEGN